MGFPRQEYWSRLPFPSPGDCPDPEIESVSPAFSSIFFTTESPEKPMLEPRPYLLHYLHGLLDCRHCILFIFLFFFLKPCSLSPPTSCEFYNDMLSIVFPISTFPKPSTMAGDRSCSRKTCLINACVYLQFFFHNKLYVSSVIK